MESLLNKMPKDLIGVIVKQAKPRFNLIILNDKYESELKYFDSKYDYEYDIHVKLQYDILTFPFTLSFSCLKYCSNIQVALFQKGRNRTHWLYKGIRPEDNNLYDFYSKEDIFEIGDILIDIRNKNDKMEIVQFIRKLHLIQAEIVKDLLQKN